MKKYALIATFIGGLFSQAASAAPIGWYDLTAAWQAGSFHGKILYDDSVQGKIAQVSGTLTDTLQSTSITKVLVSDDFPPANWAFLANTSATDPSVHDAGFYLNLLDLGATLGLDMSADNSLYDWSNDFTGYIDQSALVSYTLHQSAPVSVPEPGGIALFGAGLAGAILVKRKAQARRTSA